MATHTVVVAWAWCLVVVSAMVGLLYKCSTGTTAMHWRGAMLGREASVAMMLVVGTWRVALYMLLCVLLRTLLLEAAITLVVRRRWAGALVSNEETRGRHIYR